MATHTGHSGVVTVGGNAVAEVKDFSIEVTANTVDATTLNASAADAGWTKTKVTNRSWSVSINCFFDDAASNGQDDMSNNINQSATAMLANAGVSISCEAGGDTFAGQVLITSMSETVSGDGLVEVSFTATGLGALTIS
jgi:hypothetical protein